MNTKSHQWHQDISARKYGSNDSVMHFSKKLRIQKQRIYCANPKPEEGDDGVFNGLTLNDSHIEITNYDLRSARLLVNFVLLRVFVIKKLISLIVESNSF